MNDKTELRRIARDAIRAGRLPGARPLRTWAGMGEGAACSLCALPIQTEEVEIELEFGDASKPSAGEFRVHAHCFEAWELGRALHAIDTF